MAHQPPTTLVERLSHSTPLVLSPVRLDVAETILPSSIYTWHVFSVTQSLRPPVVFGTGACFGTPPALQVRNDELAIQFFGGSTVVTGVTLTFYDTSVPSLSVGDQYLAFVAHCSPTAASIPDGPFGWFDVDRTGTISSATTHPAAQDIVRFGTIDKLQESLPRN
jgi:hypothetical protein